MFLVSNNAAKPSEPKTQLQQQLVERITWPQKPHLFASESVTAGATSARS